MSVDDLTITGGRFRRVLHRGAGDCGRRCVCQHASGEGTRIRAQRGLVPDRHFSGDSGSADTSGVVGFGNRVASRFFLTDKINQQIPDYRIAPLVRKSCAWVILREEAERE